MKVTKEFAPVTVVIDSLEDYDLILKSLWEFSGGKGRFGVSSFRTELEQKALHLYQQLKEGGNGD
jgi:hypothetical protein